MTYIPCSSCGNFPCTCNNVFPYMPLVPFLHEPAPTNYTFNYGGLTDADVNKIVDALVVKLKSLGLV